MREWLIPIINCELNVKKNMFHIFTHVLTSETDLHLYFQSLCRQQYVCQVNGLKIVLDPNFKKLQLLTKNFFNEKFLSEEF